MKRFFVAVACLILGLSVVAQKATELYIPIGKSPGLSGKYTVTGRVDAVKPGFFVVGGVQVNVSEKTLYFLDKSKVKMSNKYGTFANVVEKSIVEVKFIDNKQNKPAEWIKIESK